MTESFLINFQNLTEESNENQSMEMRSQNVIISCSNEGKNRPQDSEDIQNSGMEVSAVQID